MTEMVKRSKETIDDVIDISIELTERRLYSITCSIRDLDEELILGYDLLKIGLDKHGLRDNNSRKCSYLDLFQYFHLTKEPERTKKLQERLEFDGYMGVEVFVKRLEQGQPMDEIKLRIVKTPAKSTGNVYDVDNSYITWERIEELKIPIEVLKQFKGKPNIWKGNPRNPLIHLKMFRDEIRNYEHMGDNATELNQLFGEYTAKLDRLYENLHRVSHTVRSKIKQKRENNYNKIYNLKDIDKTTKKLSDDVNLIFDKLKNTEDLIAKSKGLIQK